MAVRKPAPKCEHRLTRVAAESKEGIPAGTWLSTRSDIQMMLGFKPPDKARVGCQVKITEANDFLRLELDSASIFTFPKPVTQEQLQEASNDLADRSFSYVAHMIATISRELGISTPLYLPPLQNVAFAPVKEEDAKVQGSPPAGQTETAEAKPGGLPEL